MPFADQVMRQSPGKGARLMIAAAGCLTLNDALCKLLLPRVSVGQIVAIRSLVVLLVIAAAAILSRPILAQVVFRSLALHAARAGLFAVSAILFLSGLARMPLTNAVALSFLTPIFVMALTASVLRERVAAKCWVAILAGFLGAILILQPSIRGFGWASALPACAAMVTAVTDLMTRRMAARESSVSLVISSAAGALIVGAGMAVAGWEWPDVASLTIVGAAGVSLLLAYYFMVEAFRCAPAHYVSPFRYSALLWGAVIAFVGWGQLPDGLVLIGAVVLGLSGFYLGRVSLRAGALVPTAPDKTELAD